MYEIMTEFVQPADIGQVQCIQGFKEIQRRFPVYLSDESKLSGAHAEYLFFPADEAELAAVLVEMKRMKTPVTISAARTGLAGGCVPPRGAVVSMERFDQVLSLRHDPSAGEWRILAQCNVLLRDLDRQARTKHFPELERKGSQTDAAAIEAYRQDERTYFYPPDPTETSASIGGTVATNASGARSYRYGPTRNWVRRIRVMLASGEVLDIPRGRYFASPTGKFVVQDAGKNQIVLRMPDYPAPRTKSTSGLYAAPNMDLIDLFIGSEGILGVVTTVEVALLEKHRKLSVVQFLKSDTQALDFVEALRENKSIRPDFIEFYGPGALDLLRQRQADDPKAVGMPPLPGPGTVAVFFEVSFDPDAEDPGVAELETIAARCGASSEDSWAGFEKRELDRFTHLRHLLPETVNGIIAQRKRHIPELHKLGTDLAVPDDRLRDMWAAYRDTLEGLEWVAFGHIGNNHLHVNILPRDLSELEKGIAAYDRLAAKAVSFGGVVSAEHGIGKIKCHLLNLMYSDAQINQMKAVKAALDPEMMINPGDVLAA
jgi:D-lactate dehydrogenase (cytochrome)